MSKSNNSESLTTHRGDSRLAGLVTSETLSSLQVPSTSTPARSQGRLNLRSRIKILEEGFWDSLTIAKKHDASGTSVSDELSSLFFRHLNLSSEGSPDDPNTDSSDSEPSTSSRDTKPNLTQRVSPYFSDQIQLLYPGGIRLGNKDQALSLFRQTEPWSKFFLKDVRIEILGDSKSMMEEAGGEEEREQAEEEEEGEGEGEEGGIQSGRVALVTYKVKARTEDFLYEALCSSVWALESEQGGKGNRGGTGRSWKMRSHQQTPLK